MPKDEVNMQDIDITDIARGRRITAVAASELQMVPRKATRPRRPGALFRAKRRLTQFMLRMGRKLM